MISFLKVFLGTWLLVSIVATAADPPRGAAVLSVQSKAILIVVAHPDDENVVGPALAALARLGHTVQAIIATDGKDGTRVTKIPAGDVLGNIRKTESICACKQLGIQPPIFLSIDRLDTKHGLRPYLEGRKTLLNVLKTEISRFKPDGILTFGPDGEYGHPEHIVIGAAVTEILLREGWAEKYPLFYFAWKKETVIDDEGLSYVDPRYLDSKISYTDADERKSFEAARCYVTQTTQEEVAELIKRESADKTNTTYFRGLVIDKSVKRPASLFSKMKL